MPAGSGEEEMEGLVVFPSQGKGRPRKDWQRPINPNRHKPGLQALRRYVNIMGPEKNGSRCSSSSEVEVNITRQAFTQNSAHRQLAECAAELLLNPVNVVKEYAPVHLH